MLEKGALKQNVRQWIDLDFLYKKYTRLLKHTIKKKVLKRGPRKKVLNSWYKKKVLEDIEKKVLKTGPRKKVLKEERP